VDSFVDLTHDDDPLQRYDPLLDAAAAYHRESIPDMDVTDRQHMAAILDTIDADLAAGKTVYVHCWGGLGRTGMVVGCHLVRHGMDPAEALSRIPELRRDCASADQPSPQTEAQRSLVMWWQHRDPKLTTPAS
jgi:protein-tyrosine phosphatase